MPQAQDRSGLNTEGVAAANAGLPFAEQRRIAKAIAGHMSKLLGQEIEVDDVRPRVPRQYTRFDDPSDIRDNDYW